MSASIHHFTSQWPEDSSLLVNLFGEFVVPHLFPKCLNLSTRLFSFSTFYCPWCCVGDGRWITSDWLLVNHWAETCFVFLFLPVCMGENLFHPPLGFCDLGFFLVVIQKHTVFSTFLGPVENIQLLAPFVVIRNKEVNITAVVLPSHPRTVTYFWWLGNNTEVSPPAFACICSALWSKTQIEIDGYQANCESSVNWIMVLHCCTVLHPSYFIIAICSLSGC